MVPPRGFAMRSEKGCGIHDIILILLGLRGRSAGRVLHGKRQNAPTRLVMVGGYVIFTTVMLKRQFKTKQDIQGTPRIVLLQPSKLGRYLG